MSLHPQWTHQVNLPHTPNWRHSMTGIQRSRGDAWEPKAPRVLLQNTILWTNMLKALYIHGVRVVILYVVFYVFIQFHSHYYLLKPSPRLYQVAMWILRFLVILNEFSNKEGSEFVDGRKRRVFRKVYNMFREFQQKAFTCRNFIPLYLWNLVLDKGILCCQKVMLDLTLVVVIIP